MSFLAHILDNVPEFNTLAGAVGQKRHVAGVGLAGIHKAHIIYSLSVRLGRKALIIASDELEATRLCEDLTTFFGGGVYFFPSRDFTLRPAEGVSREYEHERLKIMGRMLTGDYNAVVACADAAMQLTIPRDIFSARCLEIRVGEEFPMSEIVKLLLNAGYSRTEKVEGMGQFSQRGGILDFFPPYSEYPVRIEFWGDEPDTINTFDIASQRRTESVETVLITPAVEVRFDSDSQFTETVGALADSQKSKLTAKCLESFQRDLDRVRDGMPLLSSDRYLPLCYKKPGMLCDYAKDAMMFVSEPVRVKERAKNTLWQISEDIKGLLEDGILCRGLDRYYLDYDELCSVFEKSSAVYLDTFVHATYDTPVTSLIHFTARQLAVWGGGIQLLTEDLNTGGENLSSVVMAGTQRACEAIAHDLTEAGINAVSAGEDELSGMPSRGTVLVMPGKLSAGFEYPSAGFSLITHGRLNTMKKHRARKVKPGERITSLSEITPGDYIVHSAHGIGVYEGIRKLEVQGVTKDYIKIRFAGTDTLYVPVTQLDLVSKYIGPRDDGNVRLSKMGGSEWQKTKSRVRAAVKDMARELIALYAERQKVKGHPFPDDNEWQMEFEERFEYDETDDQLRCAAEIKKDMEKPFPMDRLLCGDVGFGKTEVALRAAFKCVMGGKQCAFLVPTTILAWQHYQTVTRRMEGYPIKIELLSRFRTSKQQADIIKRLKRGEIDVIIGTHRLVQKDVVFKDLGLVIIDEEQRFGVAHKERLKETFKSVDVLTLSATPIPRTLNMALSGIRDMSTIEEAPQDRHPVQTYVLEHDWGVVSDAIKKELRRGGQVYYLHNFVETIESTANRLSGLVPDARIGIAHGKMSEDELSRVWERLLNNEIDVLVCTTIIETGVDVPNCNTLVIEEADRMGLSQLHQIRGRVGRSARRAFAYFTFRSGKVLSDIATKRLSAIREFTEFGSGFQIALRDLEIRGAGNILGSQQHGHMEAVGYDMYLKLLNEAVLEEKGEKPLEEQECMVDIQVSAHIPETYIESNTQRLEVYRHIAGIRGDEDASDVIDELIDRYGDVPDAVKSLVDVALVRNTAALLGIKEISQRENVVMLFCDKIDLRAVSGLVAVLKNRVMVSAGQKPYISVKLKDGQTPVGAIREALGVLKSEKQAESLNAEKTHS